jgi:hypothetical protein
MKTIISKIIRVLLPLCILFLLSLPALADPVDPVSDWLRVYNQAGQIVYQVSVTESLEDPNQIYYIDQPGLADPAKFGYATTLIEPDGSYSDIFGVANTAGGLFLAFSSDGDPLPTQYGSQGYYFIPEGGGIHDATMYLDPALQAQGYTAQFASVPVPSALLLLGSGLIGLAGYRRRFWQK